MNTYLFIYAGSPKSAIATFYFLSTLIFFDYRGFSEDGSKDSSKDGTFSYLPACPSTRLPNQHIRSETALAVQANRQTPFLTLLNTSFFDRLKYYFNFVAINFLYFGKDTGYHTNLQRKAEYPAVDPSHPGTHARGTYHDR